MAEGAERTARSRRAWPAIRVTLALAGAAFGIALVSGAALLWRYRPPAPGSTRSTTVSVLVDLHTVAAYATLVLVGALLVASVVSRSRVRETDRVWLWVAGALLVLFAVVATGPRLAWDQVALWAVTTGTSFRGAFDAAFRGDVRFLLVDGAQVSQRAYRSLLLLHALLLPTVVAGMGFMAWRRHWRSSPAPLPERASGDLEHGVVRGDPL